MKKMMKLNSKKSNRYQDTVLRLIREAGERMKKTIQKQLIRRSIIAVLVIAGIVLVGLEKKATFATETKEAADDQQSMETEKLYLTESSEETSNTNVDISVIEEAVYSDNDIPDSYEFEKPFWKRWKMAKNGMLKIASYYWLRMKRNKKLLRMMY